MVRIMKNRALVVKQLEAFSLRDTECFCCSVGHTLPDGRSIICDRELVEEHVVSLYGSIQTFDEVVRRDLVHEVRKMLGSESFLMPVWCYVLLASPGALGLFEGAVLSQNLSGLQCAIETVLSGSGAFFMCVSLILFGCIKRCCKVHWLDRLSVQVACGVAYAFLFGLLWIPFDLEIVWLPIQGTILLALVPPTIVGAVLAYEASNDSTDEYISSRAEGLEYEELEEMH